jgi:Domain of unknown function (DUF4214)
LEDEMTITVSVRDVSLQENVTIPVSGLINFVTSDSGDAVADWEFSGALDGGHFNLNGVPQDPDFPIIVTNAELNEVTYTAGPNDQAGLSFWLDQLSHGTTRAMVLVGFAESPENVTKTAGDHGGC